MVLLLGQEKIGGETTRWWEGMLGGIWWQGGSQSAKGTASRVENRDSKKMPAKNGDAHGAGSRPGGVVLRVVRCAPLVLDTRNATKEVKSGREKVVLL